MAKSLEANALSSVFSCTEATAYSSSHFHSVASWSYIISPIDSAYPSTPASLAAVCVNGYVMRQNGGDVYDFVNLRVFLRFMGRMLGQVWHLRKDLTYLCLSIDTQFSHLEFTKFKIIIKMTHKHYLLIIIFINYIIS